MLSFGWIGVANIVRLTSDIIQQTIHCYAYISVPFKKQDN